MRTLTLIALLLALGVALGCGGDDDEDTANGGSGGAATQEQTETEAAGGGGEDGGGGTTLKIAADPGGDLAFDKNTLTAPAGAVTIAMDNPSDLPHAVEIEGAGAEAVGETVMKGGVSEATAELEPGEYRYYCPVGNHGDAGMEGTLTVE